MQKLIKSNTEDVFFCLLSIFRFSGSSWTKNNNQKTGEWFCWNGSFYDPWMPKKQKGLFCTN